MFKKLLSMFSTQPLKESDKESDLVCPQAIPVDKSDPQWQANEESKRYFHELHQKRRDLYWALRSRVLSDDEMQQVINYGDMLNIEPMQSYISSQKAEELNAALLQQHKLRLATAQANKT